MHRKSKIRHLLILSVCTLIYFQPGYSQEATNNTDLLGLKKNAIYGSLGFGIINDAVSIYYERIISNKVSSLKSVTFFRTGYVETSGNRTGKCLILEGGLLLSRELPHLAEFAAGLHPKLDASSDFLPIGGSIAYRYQKSQGKFIFRTGLGYPEAFFISIGFCF